MKVKDKKILVNMAKCRKCEEIIVSTHRHDFRYCKCGAISVDGGTAYLKRSFTNFSDIIEMSEHEEYEREEFDWETKRREQDMDLKIHLIKTARESGSM
jgi:hypothetical protein